MIFFSFVKISETSLALDKVSSTKHCFPLVKRALSPIRELLVTTKVVLPLYSVVTVVHGHHSCIGYFHLLEACMASSGTMKASPQRKLSGPVSKVHNVFKNKNLHSTPGRQPRAIALVCNVLGICWITLTNNSKGFSCMVLGLY